MTLESLQLSIDLKMKTYFVLILFLLSIDNIDGYNTCLGYNTNRNAVMQKATCNCTTFDIEEADCKDARVQIMEWNHPNQDQDGINLWKRNIGCPKHSMRGSMRTYDYYLTCSSNFITQKVPSGSEGSSAHMLLMLGITFFLLLAAIASVFLQQKRIGKLKQRISDLENL